MDADEKKVTIKKAANLMGTSEQFVRIGLRNNRFPFGSAVKLSSKWTYYISPKLFYQYIDNKKEQSRTINCISGT
jgi:hypothetical protein